MIAAIFFEHRLLRRSKELLAMTELLLFYSIILFLPTQLGLHFWPEYSKVLGLRIDYLSPTIYMTDVLILLLIVLWLIDSFLSLRVVLSPRTMMRGLGLDSVSCFVGTNRYGMTG